MVFVQVNSIIKTRIRIRIVAHQEVHSGYQEVADVHYIKTVINYLRWVSVKMLEPILFFMSRTLTICKMLYKCDYIRSFARIYACCMQGIKRGILNKTLKG